MAMTENSLRQPMRFVVDLRNGLVQQPLRPQLMKGDRQANTIIVKLTNGSEAVDLTGVEVIGSFISPVESAELPLPGEAAGDEARVTLLDQCYAEDGYFECNVKLKLGGTERTILSITGNVLSKGSGAYIDVGDVIPSIDDIIAQYAEMKRVTEETQDAADAANEAASHTPYIGENGNWYAWDTEGKKYTDTGAKAQGQEGKPGANGLTPHIGDNGNWFVGNSDTGVKAQGPAGQNGTGSGTVTSVNNTEPDENGNVTLSAASVGARPDTWTPTLDDLRSVQELSWNGNTAPESVPDGISFAEASNKETSGFPSSLVTCIAVKGSNSRAFQMLAEKESGRMFVRSSVDGNTWGDWTRLLSTADVNEIVDAVLEKLPNASGVSF